MREEDKTGNDWRYLVQMEFWEEISTLDTSEVRILFKR